VDTEKNGRVISHYQLLAHEKIVITISISDFQDYWQRADETVSFSYRRGRMGHYKASSFSKEISSLHATRPTACGRKGLPLKRWGTGLMVLIEKTPGKSFINKMQAIVLLEADFIYYMKTVFARKMLASTQDKGQIPMEIFAKKGSNCVNAVLTKIMLCNKSRIHHLPMCIGGNGFGNFYDRVAHPPASIALQSWGIPCPAIKVLLLLMQTMRFFLRTGYSEFMDSYGGTSEERTLGFGQGNSVAGPGFLALSAQIVNAYIRDGHGACIQTSFTDCSFVLASVIYVNNTDLPHVTALVMATPREMIDHTQKSTNAVV
jgi:hypothetical protein